LFLLDKFVMRPSSDLVILVLVLLAAVALYVAGAWLATIPCTPGSRGFAIGHTLRLEGCGG
jgi:hypothetical protein